jgi:hypothetical protein
MSVNEGYDMSTGTTQHLLTMLYIYLVLQKFQWRLDIKMNSNEDSAVGEPLAIVEVVTKGVSG